MFVFHLSTCPTDDEGRHSHDAEEADEQGDPPSTGLSAALGLCASVTGVDRPSWYLLHLRGSNIRGFRAYRLSGRGTRSRS